jgi:hypothetical protein
MPQINEFCEIVGCEKPAVKAVDGWVDPGITSYLCQEHYDEFIGWMEEADENRIL